MDPVDDKVYWAQAAAFNDRILRFDLHDRTVEPLISWPEVYEPVAIAVDPGGGRLYWAQTFEDRIVRADLDGENLETILTTLEVDDPVAIALDPPLAALGIPTVSQWGLLVLVALLLCVGAFVITKRSPRRARDDPHCRA